MKKNIKFLLVFALSIFMGSSIPLGAEDNIFSQIDRLGAVIGKDNTEIYKGIAYEKGDEKRGIKQDPIKALEAYYEAFKRGNPIGAYKIGYFYWEIESVKDEKNRDLVIKKAKEVTGGYVNPNYFFSMGSKMRSEDRYYEISDLLGIVNGVYLFLHDESEKSIKALTSRKSIQNRAEAQLYLAFNYFKMNNTKMANFFLTKACNNPKKGKELIAFCKNPNKVSPVEK